MALFLFIAGIGSGFVGIILLLGGLVVKAAETARACPACAAPVPMNVLLACPQCGAGLLHPDAPLPGRRAGRITSGVALVIVALMLFGGATANRTSAPLADAFEADDDDFAQLISGLESADDAVRAASLDEIMHRLRNDGVGRQAAEALRDAIDHAHAGNGPDHAHWVSLASGLARYGPYQSGWIERVSDQYAWLNDVELVPSEDVPGAFEVRATISTTLPPALARDHRARVQVRDIEIDGASVIDDPLYCTTDAALGAGPITCRSGATYPVRDVAPGRHALDVTLRIDWLPFAADASTVDGRFVMGGTVQRRQGQLELTTALTIDESPARRMDRAFTDSSRTWPTLFHACVLIRRSNGTRGWSFLLMERQLAALNEHQTETRGDEAFSFIVEAYVDGTWHDLPPRRLDREPLLGTGMGLRVDPALAPHITRIRLTPNPSPSDRRPIWTGAPIVLEVFDDETYQAERLRRIRAAARAAYERLHGPIVEAEAEADTDAEGESGSESGAPPES